MKLYLTRSISVVIPSYQRYNEVLRAVNSVLNQTLPPLEVIVSNDGPDTKKSKLIESLNDKRVKYIEAPHRCNASATRNYGIKEARADWIALLDDDDVWLPKKLELQFYAFEQNSKNYAILAGVERIYNQSNKIWQRPKYIFQNGTNVQNVLFFPGGGVNTSTIVAPKRIFEEYSFNENAERHEDWEWLLKAGQKLPVILTPEVICERYLNSEKSLSRPGNYNYTLDWYLKNNKLMDSSTRGRFVSFILSKKASYDRQFSALPWMFFELIKNLSLTPKNISWLLLPWIFPVSFRQVLRKLISKRSF